MNGWVRLYPRWWRDRYGAEFTELLTDLDTDASASRWQRLRWRIDVVRGALDARMAGRRAMTGFLAGGLRRATVDGLIMSAVLAVAIVLTNVVFPGDPNESDGDPEYMITLGIGYLLIFVTLVAIGVHASREARSTAAILRSAAAGAAVAAVVLAVLVTLTFLVVNNIFLDLVSQQHDKRVAFAASGWSSMRLYLTVTQLRGLLFLAPAAAVFGALFGLAGGLIRVRRATPSR